MNPSSSERSANIFINYRREDSAGHTGRLFDRLSARLPGRVFMDIDTLEPGVDFVEVIEKAVGFCQVLIVVMGQEWLRVKDAAGRRRLDDPADFVRLEVATALQRTIRVIPVLVQGASMPRAEELPEDLAKLARRNAIELSDARWAYDVDRLIKTIEEVLQGLERPAAAAAERHEAAPSAAAARAAKPRAWMAVLAAVVVCGLAWAGWKVMTRKAARSVAVAVSTAPTPALRAPATLAPASRAPARGARAIPPAGVRAPARLAAAIPAASVQTPAAQAGAAQGATAQAPTSTAAATAPAASVPGPDAAVAAPAAPLTAGPGDRGRPDAGPSGTSAAVADAAMAALGGQAAWDRVHFLRFTWGVDTHYWDKWTGRHRLEGKTRDGSIVVLDNVNTRQGKAYVDGKEAAGETGARLLEFSYSAWNHDTDWLLMPYKLKDRGVNLSYVGQQQVDGKSYDEISITFDRGMRVDLTYLVWFNRDTHLMDRWAVLAVGQRREARLGIWLCQGWQRYGNIQLAPRRVQPDTRTLEFSNILVAATMPDAVFTSQAPVPGDRGRPAGPSAGTSAAVADAAMAALGGQGAWDRVHFLRFTLGAYTHYWDKWTGRHRLDGRTRDGSIVVLDDVNTRQGRAYVDGKEAAGETGARMLRSSYTDWNNVSDWLLMPYKLKDRGVKLSYVGQQQVDGRNYDEISISFDRGVPGDPSYFAWFNRDTHLMDRWAILLVGQRRDAPASVWLCQGWQRYGNIQLAPRYVQPDTRKTIEFSNILVAATMPEAVFTSQQPVPPIKAQGGGAATALGLGKP